MAQTRKRRRKHRGTQAGTIEARGRTGRAPVKADAKAIARQRREERLNREPSLRAAVPRAALAAVVFAVAIGISSKRPASGIALGVIVFAVYVPMTYYIDRFMWRRRQQRRARS